MKDFMRPVKGRLFLDVKAVPGASKTEIAGMKDRRLRVRIAAAAEDGKANAELCAYFAKILDCPKREIIVEKGEKSRLKTLSLPLAAGEKLETLIAPPEETGKGD